MTDVSQSNAGFVVVANRLPVDKVTDDDGSAEWRRSPGGLVTALAPVMRANDGAWVGWVGTVDEAPEPFTEDGMHLVPVPLSEEDVADYYEGFSNATLWPLYHDVIVQPEYHREWWEAYVRVNRRFAEATSQIADEGATVWVQDYQLQLVPQMLRMQRPDLRIGFFLHIPFPPIELFLQLPWRTQILEGLLGADLVGFQLNGAATNFCHLTERLLGLTVEDRPRPATRSTGARGGLPDLDRQLGDCGAGRQPGHASARQGDPRRARQPALRPPRCRSTRLHQGHRPPTQGLRRAPGRGQAVARGRGVHPGRHAEP